MVYGKVINTVIILEKSHCFGKDPEYGDIMHRMWKGGTAVEDIQRINTQAIGRNGIELPDVGNDDDIVYTCPKNV